MITLKIKRGRIFILAWNARRTLRLYKSLINAEICAKTAHVAEINDENTDANVHSHQSTITRIDECKTIVTLVAHTSQQGYRDFYT